MAKVWFITGTSKGFGRIWAEAALARGDRVVATARDVESLSALSDRYGESVVTMPLDVTDKSAVDETVVAAHRRFGRLDIVINNAGYGLFGAIEEVSEAQARAQIETNARAAITAQRSKSTPGDPEATGPAMLKLVDSQNPPLRIFFGTSGLPMTKTEYAKRLEIWEQWNAVSVEAQGHYVAKPLKS
jgi:NAD(P)-dependent dehydrogenase (short-subunit alcohol dehydrogenase family)